jgi:hypothetical protein
LKNLTQIIAFCLLTLNLGCSNSVQEKDDPVDPLLYKQVPKVLIITTGINNEKTELPKGIIMAIQSFNKRGVNVRLEPRDILFDYSSLSKFNIIIASTSEGYHDADRKYSLTYLSDVELINIEKFIANGGVLISGDNFGRNKTDGTDRISLSKELRPNNWVLSSCLGVTMTEKNMANYAVLGGIEGYFNVDYFPKDSSDLWTMVVDSILSSQVKPIAFWKNNEDSIPAIFQHHYKKGISFHLAFSDMLDPISDGGRWSTNQIDQFYNYVLDEFYKQNDFNVSLNPWPNGHQYAFCVTFNSLGDEPHYKRVINYLKSRNIEPTLFVDGSVNDTIISYLNKNKINTESNGFSYIDYSQLKYPVSLNDILQNEYKWNKKFNGFRFPFTRLGYWGLMSLDLHDYSFESSISANNIDFINGSVFPYNIVISNDKFYKSTDLLELAPSYHDDYYFFKSLNSELVPNSKELDKKVVLYNDYLQSFWEIGVKKHNGLFVYIGHPGLVGYNEQTLSPLKNLIDSVKSENTWISTIEEIALFRKQMSHFSYFVSKSNGSYTIKVSGPKDLVCNGTSLTFTEKPTKSTAKKGGTKVVKTGEKHSVVFNSFNGQVIKVHY